MPESSKPKTETAAKTETTAAKLETATTASTLTPVPAKFLAPASESHDAAVQNLLARRQTATMNNDEAELRRIADELAELGYR